MRDRVPHVVLVTGLPASGKTTIARMLAAALHLPLLSRDAFKETLFDTLGWSDRGWSRRLGGASWALLYQSLEMLVVAGCACIVEANFDPERDAPRLSDLAGRHPFIPVEVHCIADGETLVERFVSRAASIDRHPGHVDQTTIEEMRSMLLYGEQAPLNIGSAVLTVNTADVAAIDLDGLVSAVRFAMQGGVT
jgi:predicted kinase